MAAYIYKDSLSKPRFRADLPRPIDALRLYPQAKWDSLSIIGQSGIESLKQGFDAQEFEIFHNRAEMLKEQDFVVFEREQGFVLPAWALWAAVGISVATSVYSIIQANKMKMPGNLNRTQESATNRIQSRENEPRVNQRVERIFGQVRAYPSNIMLPYIVYKDNEQEEYAAYCLGEGRYHVEDIRDGDTLGKIMGGGWSASFYRPFDNLDEAEPYHAIGSIVRSDILRTTYESNEAVYDELDPPNDISVYIPNFSITGHSTSQTATLQIKDKPESYDLRDDFSVGEEITFSDLIGGWIKDVQYPTYKNGSPYNIEQWDYVNISQTTERKIQYEITSLTKDSMIIKIPDGLDSDIYRAWYGMQDDSITKYTACTIRNGEKFWTKDLTLSGEVIEAEVGGVLLLVFCGPNEAIPRIDKIGSRAAGPFAGINDSEVQVNISSDGIYYVDGENNDYFNSVEGRIIVREINDNDQPTGQIYEKSWTISSNPINRRKPVGITVEAYSPYKKYTVEVIRDTPRDKDYKGQVVDRVNLEAVYFFKLNAPSSYGNKTIILTKRKQSPSSSGRARKLNMLATSQLEMPDGSYKTTRYFDDIVCDAAQDSVFGRRNPETVAQMRSDLRAARDELIDYFGREDVAYFDYCIDSENITFESFVKMVANAVFCTPYLKSTMRFAPDVAQPIDTAIFGHSNKLIADESLKFSFDDLSNKKYDCVEVKYRNPDNMDAQESFFIPSQGSNPKTVEANGVRNRRNAEIHGWREWNRILYQRYSYECTVGLEATQLIPNQRIGITNNCCAETLDGHFKAWDGGVNVRFSQEADLSEGGYKIVIQSPQGGVGVFGVTQGVDLWHGVLSEAPLFDINTNLKENLTVYRIAKEDDLTTESYALQEPELTDKGIKLKAVNYAPEVYSKDHI